MDKGLEQKVSEHERRISKLEEQRETDYVKINEHNTNLATIVVKLESITNQLATLTTNWKEAIASTNERSQEAHDTINKRIEHLERDYKSLGEKLDKNYECLETEITERTIGKNSETWEKIKWVVISVVVTAVVSFLIGKLL